MVKIYVLIEQAIGYGLLKVNNCQSTDELLNILKEKNVQKLTSQIELVEFQPFSSAANAALNCVDIANGVVSEDLAKLLKLHLSANSKSIKSNEKMILVVNDKKLIESLKSASINSELSFNADNNLVFSLREIRQNFHIVLKDDDNHLVKAHIGLGHGYSRIKIKYNVNRSDNMIIQTINLLDQIDKDINTMAMRLREWFGYHYPELFKIAPDYKSYAKIVQLIKSRAGAIESNIDQLEAILQDSAKTQAIIDTAKTSMGYELTEEDFINISAFADKILLMIDQREYTVKYLRTKMGQVAPNFSTLVGDVVAARLISHAGSLINLAKFPASTIQILGAEKALFRAIKTRGNTPKYGLIFHSSFIGRAAKADKGRVSRFLAAKISLAVRLDCFMDEPINIYGEHLKRHVEDQLVYLETGKEPQKNYEMMEAAVKEAKSFISQMRLDAIKKEAEDKANEKTTTKRKMEEVKEEAKSEEPEKKKKKKKNATNKASEEELKVEPVVIASEIVPEEGSKKKKKKVKSEQTAVMEAEVKVESVTEVVKKPKKEKKAAENVVEEVIPAISEKKKKTKKEKQLVTEVLVEKMEVDTVAPVESPKKKKKNKNKQ